VRIKKQSQVGTWKMSLYCSHRWERNNRIAKLSDAENKNSFFSI